MTQMPPKVDVPRAAPVPPVPVTLADTGLTADKVEALIVKTLYAGEMSGLQLSDSVRLPSIEPARCRSSASLASCLTFAAGSSPSDSSARHLAAGT